MSLLPLLLLVSLPACLGARPLLLPPGAGRALQQQQGYWSGFPAPASSSAGSPSTAQASASGNGATAYATTSSSPTVNGAVPTPIYATQANTQPQQAAYTQQQPQQQQQQYLTAAGQQPQPQQQYLATTGQQPQQQDAPSGQQPQQQYVMGGQQQQPQQGQQQAVYAAPSEPQQQQQQGSYSQAASQAQASAPQQSSGGAPAGDMSQVLALHNALRARHGASPLSWSASLAAASQDWANRCVFQHSGGGENLAQYFSSPTQAVQAWYNEISLYDFNAGQYSSATGHATQLLWKSSTQVGCGWAPSCQLLVCRYSPPGNVLGYFQQNVSPASS